MLLSQGQDDHLLESPRCVQFLIKLLRPIVSAAIKDKAPSLGSKLLSLRQNDDILKKTTSKFDSSSVAVFSRVQEVLVNCKELKATCQNNSGIERPELCPKWLTLLTMEKACLSAISLDGKEHLIQPFFCLYHCGICYFPSYLSDSSNANAVFIVRNYNNVNGLELISKEIL